MNKTTMVIGFCLAGGVIGAGAFSTMASAQPQGAEPAETQGLVAQLQTAIEQMQVRGRQTFEAFQFANTQDADVNLGRRYLVMEGNIPFGVDVSQFVHEFTVANSMDIRTLSYTGRGSEGGIYFLETPDLNSPASILPSLKSFIFYEDTDATTTVHFDPPMRMNKGDVILGVAQNSPPSATGFLSISIQGTVPGAGISDSILIE